MRGLALACAFAVGAITPAPSGPVTQTIAAKPLRKVGVEFQERPVRAAAPVRPRAPSRLAPRPAPAKQLARRAVRPKPKPKHVHTHQVRRPRPKHVHEPRTRHVHEPGVAIPKNIWAHLERIAKCESGRNPRAVSRTGRYRGAWQFALSTWAAFGGRRYAADPINATYVEQRQIAYRVYRGQGPRAWPVCSRR